MRLGCLAPTVAAGLLVGCAGSLPSVSTGPDAVRSPDGLYLVDNVPAGTLHMRPDYVFGSYKAFKLGDTAVNFKQGARVLDEANLARLKATFEAIAREAITSTGRQEVQEAGPCVAVVNLALVALDLVADPSEAATRGYGAVTLVLEIRDGRTREALARYRQRLHLEGGWDLGSSFRRFATRFASDFERSLPPAASIENPVDCAQRGASAAR